MSACSTLFLIALSVGSILIGTMQGNYPYAGASFVFLVGMDQCVEVGELHLETGESETA